MESASIFIKKHAVAFYFILTFAISWGSLFFGSGGPAGFPRSKEEFERLLPFFIPMVLAGPSLSCLLLTALIDGRAGFRQLFSRLSKWRLGFGWYTIALMIGPGVLAAVLLALSLFNPVFVPGIMARSGKAPLLIMGIVAGLTVGMLEELGWTGFAIPRLRQRYGLFATGLIVGMLWGLWHVFLNVIWVKDAYTGGMPAAIFLTARGLSDVIGVLPAFRVLMAWVYDRTGSLLLAMLMHAALTAATIIFEPSGISGGNLLVYDLASGLTMWAAVALLAILVGNKTLAKKIQPT